MQRPCQFPRTEKCLKMLLHRTVVDNRRLQEMKQLYCCRLGLQPLGCRMWCTEMPLFAAAELLRTSRTRKDLLVLHGSFNWSMKNELEKDIDSQWQVGVNKVAMFNELRYLCPGSPHNVDRTFDFSSTILLRTAQRDDVRTENCGNPYCIRSCLLQRTSIKLNRNSNVLLASKLQAPWTKIRL